MKFFEDENSIQATKPDGTPVTIAKPGLPDGGKSLLGGWLNQGGVHLQPPAQPPQPDPDLASLSPAQPGELAAPPAPAPELPMAAQPLPDLMGAGLSKQVSGHNRMARAAEKQGQAEAQAFDGFIKENEKLEAQRNQAQIQKQQYAQERMAEVEKMNNELAKAEPKSYWADRSTGAKIAAAIAVGMGAYASAKTGGPNTAMQIIDSAIQNDFKLQMARRDAIKERGQAKLGALEFHMRQLGDDQMALDAAKASAYQRATIQVQKAASLAKSDSAKAQADVLVGQLMAAQQAAKDSLQAKLAERMDKNRDYMVPAMGQLATSKEGAQKLNGLVADTTKAKNGINELLKINKVDGKSLSPENRAKADTVSRLLQAALRTPILGPGTVNDAERKILEDIAVNPTKMFSLDSTTKTRLTTLMNTLDSNLAAEAKAYGLSPKASNIKETTRE